MDENLALCAKINFENLEKVMPHVTRHPYYMIAKAQLDEALGGKTVQETLEPHIPEPFREKKKSGYMVDDNGFGCDPDVP